MCCIFRDWRVLLTAMFCQHPRAWFLHLLLFFFIPVCLYCAVHSDSYLIPVCLYCTVHSDFYLIPVCLYCAVHSDSYLIPVCLYCAVHSDSNLIPVCYVLSQRLPIFPFHINYFVSLGWWGGWASGAAYPPPLLASAQPQEEGGHRLSGYRFIFIVQSSSHMTLYRTHTCIFIF